MMTGTAAMMAPAENARPVRITRVGDELDETDREGLVLGLDQERAGDHVVVERSR